MEITARDIQEKQFHDAWRGYKQEEVDDFLDKVAESIDRVHRENEALRRRARDLEQAVAASRDTEEMLKKTLVTAQQAAEEAIGKAKAKAEQLVTEAEERARLTDEEATQRIAALEGEMRRKTAEVEREHAARKRELEASIEHLRGFEADFKKRLRTFLEQQLAGLQALSEDAAPRAGGGRRAPVGAGRSAQRRAAGPDATTPGAGAGARAAPDLGAGESSGEDGSSPARAVPGEARGQREDTPIALPEDDVRGQRRRARGLIWRDEG